MDTMTPATDPATDGAVERELRIAARPETVYDLWTVPERLATWMGQDVRVDARPGGEYRIDYNGSDIARGAFVELDRPNRIVMTWGWEAADGTVPGAATTVEVTLQPDGDGTILRLRHSGLAAAAVEKHAEGWDLFLPRLVEAAAA